MSIGFELLPGRSVASAFFRAARAAGIKRRVIRALEPATLELFAENPLRVLESREDFERAATLAVIGDAGNLELSYGLVDALAGAVQRLGLARASDVPDPFRRVWIEREDGRRKQGVVLRCAEGEVAVFCPPKHDDFLSGGPLLELHYRGFSSSVSYSLRLCDAVMLPGAHVLHLTRPVSGGAIGRTHLRVDVSLPGTLRVAQLDEREVALWPAEILDLSAGGLRVASNLPSEQGSTLEIEVPLSDGGERPLRLPVVVRWNRVDGQGRRTQGLQFVSAPAQAAERYGRLLSSLTSGASSELEVASVEAAEEPELATRAPGSTREELRRALNEVRLRALQVEIELLDRLQHGEPMQSVLRAEREALIELTQDLRCGVLRSIQDQDSLESIQDRSQH